ncbi:mdpK, partial [Symbiodinium sp. CCMP2456]
MLRSSPSSVLCRRPDKILTRSLRVKWKLLKQTVPQVQQRGVLAFGARTLEPILSTRLHPFQQCSKTYPACIGPGCWAQATSVFIQLPFPRTLAMKVALFGATGGTGVEILRRLLGSGTVEEVRCLARSPEKLPQELREQTGVQVVSGSSTDASAVAETCKGVDAVIVSLGGPGKGPGVDVCSQSQKVINEAVGASDSRMVCVSSIGVGDHYQHCSLFAKFFASWIIPQALADKHLQEEMVRTLKNWVVVRPGGLIDGEGKGHWHAAEDACGAYPTIPRADVADFVVKECLPPSDQWLRRNVALVTKKPRSHRSFGIQLFGRGCRSHFAQQKLLFDRYVSQFCVYLGVDATAEPDLITEVDDYLRRPLPAGWTSHQTGEDCEYGSGYTYFMQAATGRTQWTRPDEDEFLQYLRKKMRRKPAAGSRLFFAALRDRTRRERWAALEDQIDHLTGARPLLRALPEGSPEPAPPKRSENLEDPCIFHVVLHKRFPVMAPAVVEAFASYFGLGALTQLTAAELRHVWVAK